MDSIQRYENKVTIERTRTVQVMEIGDARAIFELDLLVLRAGGAALFDDFFQSLYYV